MVKIKESKMILSRELAINETKAAINIPKAVAIFSAMSKKLKKEAWSWVSGKILE